MTVTLLRQTAKELAAAFFENQDVFTDGRVERSLQFRAECKNQLAFANKYWQEFIPLAKKILGSMLTQPGVTQIQKDAIYDALLRSRGAQTDEDIIAPSILRAN